MSYLFEVEGKNVIPTTEILMTPPFKEIWERDRTATKEVAKQEFTYIEFMISMKKTNPYAGYPEEDKPEKIKSEVIHIEGWEPDALVKAGMDKIVELQTNGSTTYTYYIAAKIGAEKMKGFFTTFDMNEVNERTGNPVYKPRDITSALNDTSKVLENLDSLKKKVEEEIFESTKNKGGKEIGHFAKRQSLT